VAFQTARQGSTLFVMPFLAGTQLAVSWDSQGNPLSLWSVAENASDQVITPGLSTHAP
jgi:hypothetical protein